MYDAVSKLCRPVELVQIYQIIYKLFYVKYYESTFYLIMSSRPFSAVQCRKIIEFYVPKTQPHKRCFNKVIAVYKKY